jgi:hypothetical protein
MRSYIALALGLFLPLGAISFEFEKIEPEKAGFDSQKLSKITGKFEELYQEGRIPNYVMGVYSGANNIYLAQNGRTSITGGESVDENIFTGSRQ